MIILHYTEKKMISYAFRSKRVSRKMASKHRRDWGSRVEDEEKMDEELSVEEKDQKLPEDDEIPERDESSEGEDDDTSEKTEPTSPKPTPSKKTPAKSERTPHKKPTPVKRGRGRPPKNKAKGTGSGGKGASEKSKQADDKDIEIDYLNQCLLDEGKKLAVKDKKIKDLRQLLRHEQAERKKLETQLNTPDSDSDSQDTVDLRDELAAKTKRVTDLEQEIREKDEDIADLRNESNAKDLTIAQLRETLSEQQETSKKLVDRYVNVKAKENRDCVVWVVDTAHESVIKKQLPKGTDWELFPINSVANMAELEGTERFKKAVSKAKVVILMVGSSDLLPSSNCEDTSAIYSYVAASCDRLKQGRAVAIVTVPPTKLSGTLSEVPYLNSLLTNRLKPDCLIIDSQARPDSASNFSFL